MENGDKLRIGIIVSRWNEEITTALLSECRRALLASGVAERDITVQYVPGSFELPFAAAQLMRQKKKKPNVIIALGCLIKGETRHDEYIAHAVAKGIMDLNIMGRVPVIFGVITAETEAQARARASGQHNYGYAWGLAALQIARFGR